MFTYATGLTSGISMARQIDEGGTSVADRYIQEMLKAGSSGPPLELLARAGVDLTSPKPIHDAMDLFEETVKAFDQLWSKHHP